MKKLLLLAALLVAAGTANAREKRSLAEAVCAAGRVGISLQELFGAPEDTSDLGLIKDVWEGCRQESVKDPSCYPFTFNEETGSRTIYMPGTAPSNARFDPLTADCRGRVGRWPAWSGAKEDRSETESMGAFYAHNPPGELPKPKSPLR